MILRDLSALQEIVAAIPASPPSGVEAGPAVDPRMVTTYSPRSSWREEDPWGPASAQLFHTRVEDFACDLPGSAPGLVIGRNSDTLPVRNGWKGITPLARQSIHRACAALEDQRRRLAFWTVTLSPGQLDWLEAHDSWPAFQSAIRHRLVRALRRRGLRPLVVGVVELHPERSAKEGRPCPHLHVVFVGRQHGWGRWVLSTTDLDLIICKALVAAQCFDLGVEAAGNVQPVKRSVGAYLSHYMKKGSGPPPVCGRGFQLCPRQWFFQSRPMLGMVRALTVRLPLPFVAFCHDRWPVLVERGWGSWQQVAIPDPRAPAVYSILWESAAAVGLAIAWWQESLWEADWWLNHKLLYERPVACHHPQQHQHLRAASGLGCAGLPVDQQRPASQRSGERRPAAASHGDGGKDCGQFRPLHHCVLHAL